jgi:hypothetical protein
MIVDQWSDLVPPAGAVEHGNGRTRPLTSLFSAALGSLSDRGPICGGLHTLGHLGADLHRRAWWAAMGPPPGAPMLGSRLTDGDQR